MSIEISNGVIFHQSENNHRQSFYPHQPLPNDAPQEVRDAAAFWTPEFIGSWTVVQSPPAPTLSEAIATKVAEIKTYYETIGQTLVHNGSIWQTDDKALARITAIVSALDVGMITTPPEWRTLDNLMVQMTTPEFMAFAGSVLAHEQTVFSAMVGHVDTVRSLTTVEAVQNYTFVWLPEPNLQRMITT